jgi:predicted metalloprotease with PDZ domain
MILRHTCDSTCPSLRTSSKSMPLSNRFSLLATFLFLLLVFQTQLGIAQHSKWQYQLSVPDPASHSYRVELQTQDWNRDTLVLKMPQWMPGYYQIMNYGDDVTTLSASFSDGSALSVDQLNNHSWQLTGIRNKSFTVSYQVHTHRKFVAISYVDSAHAYIIPEQAFLYADNHLQDPVSVRLTLPNGWTDVATGLPAADAQSFTYSAPNFDILYDCPILIGNLSELPSFTVDGVAHRFIGYNMGSFDGEALMNRLHEIVTTATQMMGDIPYEEYTFIGIGPGRGGIEHLNNTTVSFSGNRLDTPQGMNGMLNFLAHEYFHHYNVKRIRPYELGPFNYENGNRTNLLWISEGLSVYYEYMLVKRAGQKDAKTLYADFADNITTYESNPGKKYQSLQQASYRTWSDGPNGNLGPEADKTISYYEKGPIVGLLLDFAIRHASENNRSLDDVMRYLYRTYYQQKQRGFTAAEFQHACEQVAGQPLTKVFEYVYTTEPLDYKTYLGYGGLQLTEVENKEGPSATKAKYQLNPISHPDSLQQAILQSWLGE